MCLDINLIREVDTESPGSKQKEAFDDLVIPDDYKRVVKSLVTNHSRGSTPIRSRIDEGQQVDLIQGKGKGLFILLHGVPGVGKTSTAESVAAYTKRPLLPITCGDIGQTAEDVEERLEALFLLARKWGCVLLLDEADVFLARRERGDVARNALVSVFLRVLDYYTGILFLTTNRVGAMDEAFKARMHISLYYPKLSEESTMDIWKMNLTRLERSGRDIDFNAKKIVRFAQKHWENNNQWNGRQIRNAFSTAIALAEYDFHAECTECQEKKKEPPPRPVLLKEHFKAVAQASAEFDNYLASVLGEESYSGKARLAEIRYDEWEDHGKKTAYGKSYKTPENAVRPPHLPNGALTTATPTPASGRATRKTSIVDTRQAENKRLDELRQKKVERERETKEKEKREAAEREAADLAELAELEKEFGEPKADMEEGQDDSDEDED